MDKTLIERAKENLKAKSTEELLEIWKENDREEWSNEAFEAIRRILTERDISPLPVQIDTPPVQVGIDTVMHDYNLIIRLEGLIACILSIIAIFGLGFVFIFNLKILPDTPISLIIIGIIPVIVFFRGVYQLVTSKNAIHLTEKPTKNKINILAVIFLIVITFGFFGLIGSVFDVIHTSLLGRIEGVGMLVGALISLGIVLRYYFRNRQYMSKISSIVALIGGVGYLIFSIWALVAIFLSLFWS